MAVWIRVMGKKVVSENVNPAVGDTFTLEEMQGYVGGYIEMLRMNDGRIMWLNEEGKIKGLPYNPVADLLAQKHCGVAPWDRIVGDVLIATVQETEGDEDDR